LAKKRSFFFSLIQKVKKKARRRIHIAHIHKGKQNKQY